MKALAHITVVGLLDRQAALLTALCKGTPVKLRFISSQEARSAHRANVGGSDCVIVLVDFCSHAILRSIASQNRTTKIRTMAGSSLKRVADMIDTELDIIRRNQKEKTHAT